MRTRILSSVLLLMLFISGASAQETGNQEAGATPIPDPSRFVETGRKQYLEFQGFTVEEGVYRPKPGWNFQKGKDGTVTVARMSGQGVVIQPCECALETGGACSQVTSEGPDGQIKEIWCEDDGCGFCVGGVAEPELGSGGHLGWTRFNVVCVKGRKASQN